MSNEIPPLNALRAFEAASRSESIITAASELNVTPGAVSRQISNLEQWLGLKLFDRGYRQISLNKAGRSYANDIQDIFEKIEYATQLIKKPEESVSLRICGYPTFVQRWLISRWTAFCQEFPDELSIQLHTSLDPINEKEGYDAVISLEPDSVTKKTHQAIILLDIVVIPVCSPKLMPRGKVHAEKELKKMTLLHSATRPLDWQRWLEHSQIKGVDSLNGPMFENLNLAIQATVEGLGVLMVDRTLVAAEIESGQLVQLCEPPRFTRSSFQMVFRKAHPYRKQLEGFANWIKS